MTNLMKDIWTPEQATRANETATLEKLAAALETSVAAHREEVDLLKRGIAALEANLRKPVDPAAAMQRATHKADCS